MRNLCVIGILLSAFSSRSALGQLASSPVSGTETAPSALWVEVIEGAARLESESTRSAIQKELGIAVVATMDQAHVGKVLVEGIAGPAVRIRYESADGSTSLERSVALPVDPDRRSLVVAWVVGNLVRNEAAEILSGMARYEAPTSAATPVSAAATPEPEASRNSPVVKSSDTKSQSVREETRNSVGKVTQSAQAETARVHGVALRSIDATSDSGPARIVNFALIYPAVSLHRDAQWYRYRLSFGGVYSRIGALDGFGLTWLVDRVERRISGAQISGIWLQGSEARGVTIAGVGSMSNGNLVGAEIAGLFVVRQGCMLGVQVGGLWASAGSTCQVASTGSGQLDRRAVVGVQFGGGVAHSSAGFRGAQVSGVTANARERSEGLQLTGGVAILGSDFTGVQSGLVGNIARGRMRGLQLSGGFNYAGDVEGLQLGSVNVGQHMSGVQVGLVNVARENDGISLGILNFSKGSRFQPTYFFQTPDLHNFGFRILSGYSTSTLSFGYDAPKDIARTHFAFGPRATLGRIGVGLELGYGWVLEKFSSARTDRAHELDLIGTVTLEIVRNVLTAYGGGGVALPVAGVVPTEPRGLAQAGISLF